MVYSLTHSLIVAVVGFCVGDVIDLRNLACSQCCNISHVGGQAGRHVGGLIQEVMSEK